MIWWVRTLVVSLRLVSGMAVAAILLVLSPAVALSAFGEPGLRKVMVVLALLAFALQAGAWALGARWDRPGSWLRTSGLALFGAAMAAFVVLALPLPVCLGWILFGLFAVAVLALPLWLRRSDRRSARRVEPDAQGRLEVPVARVQTLTQAVLAALMATMSAVLLRIPVLGWVIGGVGVVFFGFAVVWLVLLVARPGPAIMADAIGMEDRSSPVAAGRVTWTELRGIRKTTTFGQVVIALTPRDWAKVVGRQPPWRRALLAFNRRITGSDDLLLNTGTLPCSAHDVAKALEQLRRENSRDRGFP